MPAFAHTSTLYAIDVIGMKIKSVILIILACSCSSPPESESQARPVAVSSGTSRKIENRLDFDKGALIDPTVRLTVGYAVRGGPGAQWFKSKTINDTNIYRDYFYLERAGPSIINADTLFDGINLPIRLELEGQFYDKVGYPEHYQFGKGSPEPARVFRYKTIRILQK
ncbi:MAG: hypothetical protein EOP48_08570 [Sphingobacteriales bacterium]|nr:MAG: hypothetical protein EOP48_08570 [Sphingobacteriales bacterium]